MIPASGQPRAWSRTLLPIRRSPGCRDSRSSAMLPDGHTRHRVPDHVTPHRRPAAAEAAVAPTVEEIRTSSLQAAHGDDTPATRRRAGARASSVKKLANFLLRRGQTGDRPAYATDRCRELPSLRRTPPGRTPASTTLRRLTASPVSSSAVAVTHQWHKPAARCHQARP